MIIGLPIFYLKLEPWLLEKHKNTHLFLNQNAASAFLIMGVAALVSASWHMPTSINDFLLQLIMVRVVGDVPKDPNVFSHAIPMFTLLMITPFMFLWERNALKGLIMNIAMGFWGEGIWMFFYVNLYFTRIDWVKELPLALSLVLILISVTVTYMIKYKPSKIVLLMPVWVTVYATLWLLFYGFRVTVQGYLINGPKFGVTPWYFDPMTNLIEVTSMPIQVIIFSYLALRGTSRKPLSALYGINYNPFGIRGTWKQ